MMLLFVLVTMVVLFVFLTNCTVFITAAVQTIETSFDRPYSEITKKKYVSYSVEYASEEQNNTMQYNTIQYNTIQYNIVCITVLQYHNNDKTDFNKRIIVHNRIIARWR